jgi:hypothetical protein
MKQIAAILLLVAVLSGLAPHACAGDADDVSKLAHDFVVSLATMDFDKLIAFGRPGDSAYFEKPPDEVLRQFRDMQNLAPMQEIRREIADELNKAVSLGPPAFTPDNSCAIVTATPVDAEARKLSELMVLYMTYVSAANQDKAQKQPMPKLEDIRARILVAGSPEQLQIDSLASSFPKLKARLQFEKTAAGWRVNLNAFKKELDAVSASSP